MFTLIRARIKGAELVSIADGVSIHINREILDSERIVVARQLWGKDHLADDRPGALPGPKSVMKCTQDVFSGCLAKEFRGQVIPSSLHHAHEDLAFLLGMTNPERSMTMKFRSARDELESSTILRGNHAVLRAHIDQQNKRYTSGNGGQFISLGLPCHVD